jgi:hypothetical protein
MLQISCLATGAFPEPFSSNGCLYWLHSFCFEQICHNILVVVVVVVIVYNAQAFEGNPFAF